MESTIEHIFLYPLVSLVSLVLGVALGVMIARRIGLPLVGVASLGLLVGLINGMSSSPVVATAITAGFALATHLTSELLKRRTQPSRCGS